MKESREVNLETAASTIKLGVLWLSDKHTKVNKINKRKFICLEHYDPCSKTMKKIEK